MDLAGLLYPAGLSVTRISSGLPVGGVLEYADEVSLGRGLEGHEVVVTQDGVEALEKLQAAPARFDVLVTDVQMPGLDGIALVEKGLAVNAKLRVVLMSGFADELGRAAHLKDKISRVITKPFTLEQIRSAVKAALG